MTIKEIQMKVMISTIATMVYINTNNAIPNREALTKGLWTIKTNKTTKII